MLYSCLLSIISSTSRVWLCFCWFLWVEGWLSLSSRNWVNSRLMFGAKWRSDRDDWRWQSQKALIASHQKPFHLQCYFTRFCVKANQILDYWMIEVVRKFVNTCLEKQNNNLLESNTYNREKVSHQSLWEVLVLKFVCTFTADWVFWLFIVLPSTPSHCWINNTFKHRNEKALRQSRHWMKEGQR